MSEQDLFQSAPDEADTMHIQPVYWALEIISWPNPKLLCQHAQNRLALQNAPFEMAVPITTELQLQLTHRETHGLFNIINALSLQELTALNAAISILQEDSQLSNIFA